VEVLVKGQELAVNALDFSSDIPFEFDRACQASGIPVLHPYNFGWGGFVTVVMPDGQPLSLLQKEPEGFELKMAEYVTGYGAYWHVQKNWLEEVLRAYRKEKTLLPPPQLSVGSWIAAGLCVNVMFDLATGRKDVRAFPKFYLASVYNDEN
jgi:hypothetical protein